MLKFLRGLRRLSKSPETPRATGPLPTGGLCVVVVDESGSMSDTDFAPSRIEAAKSAADAYVLELGEHAAHVRVAVIGYAGSARRYCEPLPLAEIAKVRKAISKLHTRGSTNLTAALIEARAVFEEYGARGGQVIVLTDGHHRTLSETVWLRFSATPPSDRLQSSQVEE